MVYFRLCIDLMHILPPVAALGFDGSHHPRYAEQSWMVSDTARWWNNLHPAEYKPQPSTGETQERHK